MAAAMAAARELLAHPAVGAYDAAVRDGVFGVMEGKLGCALDPASPLTVDLPLVRSPTPVVTAIGAYLAVVGLAVLKNAVAPAVGEPAKPSAPFRAFMILHNAFLSALSLYMCLTCIKEAIANNYSLWGNPYSPTEVGMANVIWLFYVSKMYEFFDTFIMIAKGSYRQVSVLHVYHHGSIAAIWWAITYHAPGGDAYFSAAMNSWVHVVMYFYYLCSSLVGKDSRKKYLWWGKYLTQMQMLQFSLNLFQATYDMVTDGPYPRWIITFLFWYMVSLLGLFGHFYVKRWVVPKRMSKSKSA